MLVSKYGDRDAFLTTYNPLYQREICTAIETCYFGDYPTLADLKGYGKNFPTMWLIPQLYNLSEYCGCKDKLQGEPLEECAFTIATEFYYLKISELMLFFHRFKSGRYGRFYGSVDPLIIVTSIREFLNERLYAYREREQQERAREREEWAKNAVTWEQYCQIQETKLREEEKTLRAEGKSEEADIKKKEADSWVNRAHPIDALNNASK